MTRNELKQKLRAIKGYRPEDEAGLDVTIDEAAQYLWDADEWTWRTRVGTFTATSATHQLPQKVDNILELTYADGANNIVVNPKPSYRVAELYDNVSRAANGDVYYYSLYSATPDRVTIELTPNGSGKAFTYRYYVKHDYGNLNDIPEKLHSLVFTAARMFLAKGMIEEWPALASAIDRDKPIRQTRWAMGVDPVHAIRVAGYNRGMAGTSQDVRRPID